MSFEKLKKEELLEIADGFGTEVAEGATKAQIIAALAEDGVDFDAAVKQNEAAAAAAEEVKAEAVEAKQTEEKHLLKMTRDNGTYEVRGVKFVKAHPFALVPLSDAEWIVENEEGFRFATPREAQEFYG